MVRQEKESPYISKFNSSIELLPNNIYCGDCLKLMNGIKDKSIDMILCDLPYGTTACSWDEIIPFDKLWLQYERIIKDNGAIVLFGNEPFSTKLRISKFEWYKYDWIWEKSNPSNTALANKQPMRYHEVISIFYKQQPIYNKQMIHRKSKRIKQAHKSNYIFKNAQSEQTNLSYIEVNSKKYNANYKNPSTILKFNSLRPNAKEFVKHPTQKPVTLCKYLIKTYTNENDLILDNCIGSGTTAIACINTNRKYIGIELNKDYYNITIGRIKEHMELGKV